jgi:hypothetical protein
MDREIQQVEFNLTDVGRRCNPKLVEKKHTHFNQIRDGALERTTDTDSHDDKRAFGAQLALLHRCTASISRILRRRGSPLLVAKLLVVCRLLHKTLSQNEPAPPFLEDLRSQLASLRRTLLKRTDKRLSSADSTADDTVEALAAYCLATSSSSDEAVRHFHQRRLEAIGNHLGTGVSEESVLGALVLYIRTLQTSKIILSRRLSDILAKLKTRPLLSDPEIRNLDALGIDVLGHWVTPDISNFTPWIKLSELTKQEAEKVIKQWSSSAFEAFAKGCQKSLASWVDLSDLLSVRKKTLDTWLDSWSLTPVHSSLGILEGIRTVFNEQLIRILGDEAKKLEYFGQRTSSTISEWDSKDHASIQPLWEQGLISMDYSNGGAHFKQAVVDRLVGRNEDVSTVLEDYQSWLSSIERSKELVGEMRRTRWVDILGESEEDLDIDITSTLNEDDPRVLSEALQQAVQEAFNNLQSSFSDTFSSFGPSNQSPKAAFILRLIRHVRRGIPRALIPSDFAFSSDFVPKLQDMLAAEVAGDAGQLVVPTDPNTKVPGRTLWEGDPELPVQPSPWAFKFLRRLMGTMDQCGPDLWDPSTVQVLKGALQGKVAASISSALGELEASSGPDENASTPAAEEQEGQESQKPQESEQEKAHNLRDRKTHLFFDAVYFSNAFSTKPPSENPLAGTVEQVQKSLDSGFPVEATIEKAAADYWGRTRLLFGLLGVS